MGIEPGFTDRQQRLGYQRFRGVDGDDACAQLKSKPAHPGHRRQSAANFAFLRSAIHGVDAERRQGLGLGGSADTAGGDMTGDDER